MQTTNIIQKRWKSVSTFQSIEPLGVRPVWCEELITQPNTVHFCVMNILVSHTALSLMSSVHANLCRDTRVNPSFVQGKHFSIIDLLYVIQKTVFQFRVHVLHIFITFVVWVCDEINTEKFACEV